MAVIHPAVLVPLALLAATALLAWRRRAAAARMLSLWGAETRPGFARPMFLTLGAVSTGLALAAPPLESGEAPPQGPGSAAIVFVLDVSRSMEVMDVGRPRRSVMFEMTRRLIGRHEGARFGVVIAAGTALLLCPLTMDADAVEMALDEAERASDAVPGGSDLSAGVEQAVDALRDAVEPRSAVIMSDGETTSGDVALAAQQAARQRVVVHAIGIGTVAGGTMKVSRPDADARAVEAVRISRLDTAPLEVLARTTGGRFTVWRAGETDAEVAGWALGPVPAAPTPFEPGRRLHKVLLLAGAVCWLIELSLSLAGRL